MKRDAMPDSVDVIANVKSAKYNVNMDNLTPEQFHDSLRKGLGRAVQHVRNSQPEAVRDALANACTEYLGMNLQDEGSRVPWLFRMIEATGELNFYRQKVVEAVEQIPDDPNAPETFNELFGFLAEFAARGDGEVLEIMRRRFYSARVLYEPHFGFDDLFRFDGIDALLRFMRKDWIRIADEELWASDDEIKIAEEQLGKEVVQAALEEASRNDESIRLYLERIRQQQITKEAEKAARDSTKKVKTVLPSLRELIDDMKNDWPTETEWTHESFRDVFWSRRNRFTHAGRFYAKPTLEELEYAYQKLLETNDPGWQYCLLGVFTHETMPRFDPRLFALLFDTPYGYIRWAAGEAFSRVTDPAIRDRGLELIAKEQDWHYGIGLLEKNFQTGDELLLQEKLDSLPPDIDPDDLHAIGQAILDLARANPDAHLESLLLWVYEKTYCPPCRYSAVKCIIQRNAAPQYLIEECLDDSYQYTRELAQITLQSTE